ncbi:MAG TPA: SMP-30/gluconolactonase/LRE family protein [Aggregatilineales bacterium]|nr:SMP-30/gluconolactonase/LRE family protein [Aggregatilineales bacterium]
MELEAIADYACAIGENPLWHPTEERLYWTDIGTGRLFRFHPASGKHEPCYSGEPVGGFTIQADGRLLLFMARGAIKTWHDGELTTIIDAIPEERASRFNDVIADPVGRVFCGTMPSPDHPGSLYRLDTDGTLTRLLDGIACSNGMAFTLDRRQMYYTDSLKHVIYLFDYDQKSGSLTNQRVFATVPEDGGVPDGMTVDTEGYIWSARWDGRCLVRYAPDGSEDRRIQFPVPKVSSAIFAGRDYRDLYVTTAGGDHKAEEGPQAGTLFRLDVGVGGLPEFLSRVRL